MSAVAFCRARKEWASAGGDGESLFLPFVIFVLEGRGRRFRREEKGRNDLDMR